MNPFNMMGAMDMIGQIRNVMSNPSSVADVMLKKGSIDQNTYNQIKGMGPQQIGHYMMNNGLMNPQQVQNVYQNQVPGIQKMI